MAIFFGFSYVFLYNVIITGQGYMPVDVIGDPVRKTYCAFWRKDNSGYYIEDFADMLKEAFA